MNNKHPPGTYTICIKGHLGEQWKARFAGLSLTLTDDGDTCLKGTLADQAALHGLLRTLRDAGLELLSINRAD